MEQSILRKSMKTRPPAPRLRLRAYHKTYDTNPSLYKEGKAWNRVYLSMRRIANCLECLTFPRRHGFFFDCNPLIL